MSLSYMNLLAIAGVCVVAVVGFHYLVHRSLAPARLVELITPGDVALDYREVSIATENGRTLYGWFIPGPDGQSEPAVVLLHGWGGNAGTLLPLAPALRQAGFAVLLFDARCHGRSDDDRFVSMPRFAEDLDHAIGWLQKQPAVDAARIAVVGHSVGAAAALLAASRREDLAAVVSIAAFAHPQGVMRRLLAAKFIPYWPVGWYILRYVQYVIGHRFDEIAPLTTISRVRCPTLLVHGANDTTVPVAEAYAIYAMRHGAPVQLQIIPGSHEDYGDIERQARRLVAFLQGSLAASSSPHAASTAADSG